MRRLPAAQWERQKGAANRAAFRRVVDEGPPPGVLAYADGAPVGWCAVAPREVYVRLERSRSLRRINAEPVWSISCLFVTKPQRRTGVSVALLRAGVEFARGQGARQASVKPARPAGSPSPHSAR